MRARWPFMAGLFVALLIGVVWVGPGLLDWSQYRDEIAALTARGIGRPVEIAGDIKLSLLPQPVLTAARLTVPDTGDGVTLSARELRLRVSLAGLLGGHVDARELTLRGVDLRLPWPPAPGALSQRPPAWLSGLQARIENGRLQVGSVAFTGIDANVATDADTGSLSATGQGKFGANDWRFTVRLSQPGRDGSAALDASLDGDGKLRDTGGTFSGQLGADGALSGRATGRGPDLSLLLPAPAQPWRGEGRLTAAGGLAIADELQIELAGMPARGAVALRVAPSARLDIAFAANRLDLDSWWPVLVRGAAPSLPTGVDLSAEAATFAGGQVRRLRAGLDLGPDGAEVREATAELPGQASLTLDGTVRRAGAFSGHVRLGAPDLRATLRWLEGSVPGLGAMTPPEALRTADLAGDVSAEDGLVSLDGLRGTLDGAAVSGSAAIRPGDRPGIQARLTFDQLALDPWLPDLDRLDTAMLRPLTHRFDAFDADLRVEARQATWRMLPVSAVTLDVQAQAAGGGARLAVKRLEATARGVHVAVSGNLGEDGRLTGGKIDVAAADAAVLAPLVPPAWPLLSRLLSGPAILAVQASGPPEALAVRLTAEASDVRLEAQPVVDARAGRVAGPVMLHHPGAPRLLRLFGLTDTASWIGDGSFSLLGRASFAPGVVHVDRFDLAAGDLRANGQVEIGLGPTVKIAGSVAAETLPLPSTLAQLEPLPTARLLGWQAAVQFQAAQVTSGNAMVMRSVAADVSLSDGVLTVRNGVGTVADASATFGAAVDATAEPPRFTAQGSVVGAVLAGPMPGARPDLVDLASGTADASFALSASGHGAAALQSTLGGSVHATVRDGVLAGLDLARAGEVAEARVGPMADVLDSVRQALTRGTTAFAQLDLPMRLDHGMLSLDGATLDGATLGGATLGGATLGDPTQSAAIGGSIDLSSGTLDVLVQRQATARAPSFGVRIAGPVGAPVRTPELAALARVLAESAP